MRKPLSVFIGVMLLLALFGCVSGKMGLDDAINGTSAYMLNTVKEPQAGSVGGEWAVLGLARSGCDAPDLYYENYYKTVETYIRAHNGILDDVKYTDYSRVILGLTAAGYDPRDVAGCDLTAPLEDFESTVRQGITGSVFALIALDSMDYPNSRRDDYVRDILRRQLNDGGWNSTAGTNGAPGPNEKADPDVTGMALQALARYQDRPEVREAADRALDWLSKMQNVNGGYVNWGSENVESAVQVLVALCELGVSVDDARFVKNGRTLVDNILTFQNADGGFTHTRDSGDSIQISSEQALYGLVAARRAENGQNSLYRMGDAVRRRP